MSVMKIMMEKTGKDMNRKIKQVGGNKMLKDSLYKTEIKTK